MRAQTGSTLSSALMVLVCCWLIDRLPAQLYLLALLAFHLQPLGPSAARFSTDRNQAGLPQFGRSMKDLAAIRHKSLRKSMMAAANWSFLSPATMWRAPDTSANRACGTSSR